MAPDPVGCPYLSLGDLLLVEDRLDDVDPKPSSEVYSPSSRWLDENSVEGSGLSVKGVAKGLGEGCVPECVVDTVVFPKVEADPGAPSVELGKIGRAHV